MVAVRVVQVAIDQVVDVIAMGHRFVAAARAVDVATLMAAAAMVGRAGYWVLLVHRQGVFFNTMAGRVVQVAVVEIVDVIAVLDGGVAAARAVVMIVIGVYVAHLSPPQEFGVSLPALRFCRSSVRRHGPKRSPAVRQRVGPPASNTHANLRDVGRPSLRPVTP